MSYKKTLKDNLMRLEKKYMNEMRILTKRNHKKNQIEILELKNTRNEIKK